MVMICFVLDLPNILPSALRALKLALLQLANFYAVPTCISYKTRFRPLSDRLGLCCIRKDRKSGSDVLEVTYAPGYRFSLKRFHHAVNSLPKDAFSPTINDSGALSVSDMKFASFLNSEVLYKWGGHEKDVSKKVILISSCVPEELDSVKKEILMDAAEKCVSIEFLLLEQTTSHLGDLSENINNFVKQISDLENCSFHTLLPDPQVLSGIVKRWVLDLKDDRDAPLQARFIFKNDIFGSVNRLSCTLSATSFPLEDGFSPCQSCRCHGIPLFQVPKMIQTPRIRRSKQFPSCPVTGDTLKSYNLVTKSLMVGEHTVLLLPFGDQQLQYVSRPVDLKVIERTNLGSLSEDVVVGPPFFVSPFCDSDNADKAALNTKVFQGLCSALHSLDQGLVCSSRCNIETKGDTDFYCYYILEPSEKGLMLLRRLAGSEEALPFPDVSQLASSSATSEIGKSVLDSLQKIEARDYNPFLHERGFHQKLNSVVKLSFQPGPATPCPKTLNIEPDVFLDRYSNYAAQPYPNRDGFALEDAYPIRDATVAQDQVSDRITNEWEQLDVSEGPKKRSPKFLTLKDLLYPEKDSSGKINKKTSRILERLEAQRQLKRKSPIVKSTATVDSDSSASVKTPLLPFPPIPGSQQNTQSSQPMKPNFPRNNKRKR